MTGDGLPPERVPRSDDARTARTQAAAMARRVPSADVLKGMDDARRVRRLRRKLRFWRLLGRVR